MDCGGDSVDAEVKMKAASTKQVLKDLPLNLLPLSSYHNSPRTIILLKPQFGGSRNHG